ncbi:MAG: hypothetical protein KAI73_07675 [Rhodospirillaceae bacterium]|nr:hypothetical protein [Rhodospirillaceae bacterium]
MTREQPIEDAEATIETAIHGALAATSNLHNIRLDNSGPVVKAIIEGLGSPGIGWALVKIAHD